MAGRKDMNGKIDNRNLDKLVTLSQELNFLKDKALAVLVFGSSLEGKGRDI